MINTKLGMLTLCVAAFGVPYTAVSADSPSDETFLPPPPPPNSQPGGQPQCVPEMGQGGAMQPGMCPQGPNGPMMGPEGRRGGPGFEAFLPDELKARIETLRKNREQLRDLWQKAVLSRGDKPVVQVREEFKKTNAALIADIKKSDEAIREDIRALQTGFEKDHADDREERGKGPEGRMTPGAGPFGMDDTIKAKIDADIVEHIKALKEPLTTEVFAKIAREVIESHRNELEERFDKERAEHFGDMPNGMPLPMMAPELARMRDAMGHMRGSSFEERRELRAQLREAMKIQDQTAREAAIKKILDDKPVAPEGPAPDGAKAPEGESESGK